MSKKYKVGRTPKQRGRRLAAVVVVTMLIVGGLGGFFVWDTHKNGGSSEVQGVSRTVEQQAEIETVEQRNIDEPFYALKLPGDWKEKERKNTPNEQSVTWQASKKGQDNRWLTVYIDRILPDLAVNRLLPIEVADNKLTYHQLSENCVNFTPASPNTNKLPTISKWQGIDFICDVPNFVQNKVGTGSAGTLNATPITGPAKGKHQYFFVYTDHNIQPDYQIFYNALRTFEAK